MRSHELLRSFGIFALDRLKYFLVMAQHRKPAVRNAFDAPLEHELFTGVVQDAAHRLLPAIRLAPRENPY